MLRGVLGFTGALLLGFAVRAATDANWLAAGSLLVGALALPLAYVIHERTRSGQLAGNYVAGVVLCTLAMVSYSRGGLSPVTMQWAILIPLGVSLLGKMRTAYVWGALIATTFIVLTALQLFGAAPPLRHRPPGATLMSELALLSMSLWLSILVERVRRVSREQQESFSRKAMAGQKLESLGRLAGGIAHDFNNVLAVVLARVDDALHRIDRDDPQYEDLRAVRTAARRGASLASELVAFSRRGPATYDVLRPQDIMRDVEQVLARLVREDVAVDVVVEHNVEPIEGDRDHLVQVLLNLGINAQDAMPSGGRMRLELRTERVETDRDAATGILVQGRYAVMSVGDEGIGMSRETVSRIFEPFFTTKERGRGSGIGLATVHAIVTQHGGQLRVHSHVGAGSTFEVYLPLTRRSDELVRTAESEDGSARASSQRILLVEDDDLVRRALEIMLGRAGHRVSAAANGAEAVARWEEAAESFDLVLTDVLMPGMTGPDLVRQLREMEPRLRVVYMSGHVDDAMRGVDLERDRALFVRKPASRSALLRAVEQMAALQSSPPEPRAEIQEPSQ